MSLYGYKPKTKPALWMQSPAAKERLERLRRVQEALKATKKLLKPIPLIRKRAKAAFLPRRRGKAAAKPRKRLRARSSAMEARMKLYRAAKARYLKDYPSCQCGCGRKSKEVHHTRGRLGSLLLDETYWLALAPECHAWVHNNIDAARERNLIAQPGDWNRTT